MDCGKASWNVEKGAEYLPKELVVPDANTDRMHVGSILDASPPSGPAPKKQRSGHGLDPVKKAERARRKKETAKLCEVCNLKLPSFGLPSDKVNTPAKGRSRAHVKWCGPCSKAFPGAIDFAHCNRKVCEICKTKRAVKGLKDERKIRWCTACAKTVSGVAVDLNTKMCVDCGERGASFGMSIETKAQWCTVCARNHSGAFNLSSKRCEDCRLKWPGFGMPHDMKSRWCATCAKSFHPGAQDVVNKKCEACREKTARCGMPSENIVRHNFLTLYTYTCHVGARGLEISLPAVRARSLGQV